MNETNYLDQENETMGENSFMTKLLKKRLNQKGLTLIELLAVIVILAIVAAIAIPAIANLIQNQRDKAILADGSSIISAAKLADAAGACTIIDPDAGEECNQANASFVDYVGDVAAAEDGTLTYSVTGQDNTLIYSAFADIAADSDYAVAANTIDEADLNTLMNQ